MLKQSRTNSIRRRPCGWLGTASIFLLTVATPAAAEKTDVILLENGDYVTGEVKTLEFGRLRYGTDSMGTVQVEWDDIHQVTSKQSLQVEVADGRRHFGRLEAPPRSKTLLLVAGGQAEEIEMERVVRITPIDVDETFWQRLDGSLSYGFTYTKASEVAQSTFGTNVTYRARKYEVSGDLNSIVTSQKEADTTARHNLSGGYRRFRQNRWFSGGFARAEVNDELGIDLRVLVGGAFGRFLRQTNKSELSVTGGLVVARESFDGPDDSETSLEGLFSFNWSVFRYDTPKTDLTLDLQVYPGLSSFGRLRSEFDARLRRELIEDFFWDLTFYDSFNNEPPEGASKNDYGVVTSLGWSF